jgi:hypothetical protein
VTLLCITSLIFLNKDYYFAMKLCTDYLISLRTRILTDKKNIVQLIINFTYLKKKRIINTLFRKTLIWLTYNIFNLELRTVDFMTKRRENRDSIIIRDKEFVFLIELDQQLVPVSLLFKGYRGLFPRQ